MKVYVYKPGTYAYDEYENAYVASSADRMLTVCDLYDGVIADYEPNQWSSVSVVNGAS